jgi:hypothetical protein
MKSASWATRAIKSGKQLLKLPKRLGVPCGGQAGLSDDAVTGSKASMSAQDCRASSWRAVACSASGDGGRKPVQGRIANAKSFGWAIYAAGFAIWLFGYLR